MSSEVNDSLTRAINVQEINYILDRLLKYFSDESWMMQKRNQRESYREKIMIKEREIDRK